jgi:hypothetical protein
MLQECKPQCQTNLGFTLDASVGHRRFVEVDRNVAFPSDQPDDGNVAGSNNRAFIHMVGWGADEYTMRILE